MHKKAKLLQACSIDIQLSIDLLIGFLQIKLSSTSFIIKMYKIKLYVHVCVRVRNVYALLYLSPVRIIFTAFEQHLRENDEQTYVIKMKV